MGKDTVNPYADFQQPAQGANPYAEFQQPAKPLTASQRMQQKAQELKQARLGSSVGDTVGNVLHHAANLVSGPYNAIAQPPTEEEEKTYGPNIDSPLARVSLAADRMFVRPTTDAAKQAVAKFKAGDTEGGMESALDAVPVVGSWARNIENEARDKGGVAALAGLATDALAPKAIEKGVPLAASAVGKLGEGAQRTGESLINQTVGLEKAVRPRV